MDGSVSYRWLRRSARRSNVASRLICFPHAGAGASSFARWAVDAPAGMEICSVQLPGREDVADVPAATDLAALLPALVDAIASAGGDGLPFAFYGHSLGAALACRAALTLSRSGHSPVRGLLVSGRRGPLLPRRGPPLEGLTDDELAATLAAAGGGSGELWRRPHWRQRYLDLIRNDLLALERMQPPPVRSLGIPVVAFHAAQDIWVSESETAGWEDVTHGPFALRRIGGGHFDHHLARQKIMSEALALCHRRQDEMA